MSSTDCSNEGCAARSPKQQDVYLTLAPRGLESFAIKNISSQLSTGNYTCWISEIGPSPLARLNNAYTNKEHETASKFRDPIGELATRIEYNKFKKREKKRKKLKSVESEDHPTSAIGFDEFVSKNEDLSRVTGSIDSPDIGSHTSLGYHTVHDEVEKVLSVPGTLEGIVLVAFRTDAPPNFVASMLGMGCGPLLALTISTCLQVPSPGEEHNYSNCPIIADGKIFDYDQTLESAHLTIDNFFESCKDKYSKLFQSAFQLWQRHKKEVWYASNSIYGHFNERGQGEGSHSTISYRLSCTRSHSKKYSHKREALVPHLGEWLLPTDITNQHLGSIPGKSQGTKWIVDLKNYDIEIVSMIHDGCLTIAIPLRPYQLWGSRSYRSNTIPIDGSGCFGRLGPKRSLGRYIHLRPSTADILIRIADLPPHSIILDPCAGIGTINIRASFQQHYGLGGEIVPSLFEEHAPYFLSCNSKYLHSKSKGIVDMAGWDGTMLPLRSSFIDAVISDIPFGQKCLNHNELHAFVSGFIYECARVLVRNTGKMVLLCGDYEIILSNIASLNARSIATNEPGGNASDNVVFHLPCKSIFPVNITGILAWILIVQRGPGKPIPSTHYRVKTKQKSRLSYARK